MEYSSNKKLNKEFSIKSTLLILFAFFCSFFISFGANYPNLELDTFDKIVSEEINITGKACYGCEVSLYVNNELKSQKLIESPSRIINWNTAPSTLEMVAGEKFQINYSPSAGDTSTIYDLTVFGEDKGILSVFDLSPEYSFDKLEYDGETIVAQSSDFAVGGLSKTVYFKDELVNFYFDNLEKKDFISGQNTIKIVVSGNSFSGANSPVEQSFSVEVEKYSILFEMDDKTKYVANTQGAQLIGEVKEISNFDEIGFAYLINGPGEIITNTGLMRNFDVVQEGNKFVFNVSIPTSAFREGQNSLDLIGYTKGNRGNFIAFKRLNITRDSEPPQINILKAELFDGGQVAGVFKSAQIQDTLFTGYSTIRLNISVDAEVLTWEYDSSEKEEIVINDSVIVDFKAKDAGKLVKEIVNLIEDLKSTEEIMDETGVTEGIISGVNQALKKLEEEKIRKNSEWYEQVALELGIGYHLILRAEDKGGNTAIKSIKVIFNDEDPELIIDDMKPSSIFKDKEVFSNIGHIEGRTNQPNVDVSFIVIGPDDYVQGQNGNRVKLSCDNAFEYYKQGIWRNYEDTTELDNLDGNDEVSGRFAVQFDDIIGLIRGSLDFKSDSNGNFGSSDIIDAVVSGEFVTFRSSVDEDRTSSSHRNELCALLKNQFGRTNLEKFDVSFEAGNYDWDVNGITFNQNSINPYEIESSTGDVGGYRTGVVIEMDYTGQFGESDDLEFNQVTVRKRGSDPKDVRVVGSEVVYYYQHGTLNLYIPLEFSKRDILISEYPDTEIITLEILPRASVQGYQIDSSNPEFVDIEVYYDKDLTTKWLTPEMIDKGIRFLNATKAWTGDLKNATRKLVPIGALSCVGAKFWYSIQTANLDPEKPEHKETLDELQEKLYTVCDRTYCSAAPHKCDPNDIDKDSESFLNMQQGDDGKWNLQETPEDLSAFNTHKNDGTKKILSQFTSLDVGGECRTPDGKAGRYIRGEVQEFEEDAGSLFFQSIEAESNKVLPRKCVAYSYKGNLDKLIKQCEDPSKTAQERRDCKDAVYKNPENIEGLNVNSIHSACYNEEAPHFDNTRCLGNQGYDPSDTIIDSVMCGCIPETYQHLNKLYKVQENIQSCLEDVKTAKVEGTYCERLVSVSTCDLVTGIVFRFTQQKDIGRQPRADPNTGVLGLLGAATATDNLLEDRYEGTSFYSSGKGFNTKNVANALCLFAINKDFAAFETALVGDLDRDIQVSPEYAQAMPQLRFESFNPITGEMTIQYKFTHNGISGGSPVKFKYELICDSSKVGGEYCPSGVTKASDISNKLNDKTLTIPAAGESQELIEYRDIGALFVYNVLRTTVEYQVGDETKTRIHEEKITRGPLDVLGSGSFGACSYTDFDFGLGKGGISCASQFSEAADITYYIIDSRTHVTPSISNTATISPNGVIGLNVFYTARGDLTGSSRGKLWYKSSNCNLFDSINLDQSHISGGSGNFYVEFSNTATGVQIPKETTQTTNEDGSTSETSTGPETKQEGNCNLELRMTGNNVDLTAETFDLDLLEKEEIQTDPNTANNVNGIYKTSFILKPSVETEIVEVIYPLTDATLCVNDVGIPQSTIQIAGTGSFVSNIGNYMGELKLSKYAQSPIKFGFGVGSGYQLLGVSSSLSGSFNGVDFNKPQLGEITIKNGEKIIDKRKVSLRMCN